MLPSLLPDLLQLLAADILIVQPNVLKVWADELVDLPIRAREVPHLVGSRPANFVVNLENARQG